MRPLILVNFGLSIQPTIKLSNVIGIRNRNRQWFQAQRSFFKSSVKLSELRGERAADGQRATFTD